MSHVFLCTICGQKTGRLLSKGKCMVCRNKSLVMFSSESHPEFVKEYRRLNKLHSPTSPMTANILVTIMISALVGIGWIGFTYFHDLDTARSTIASLPYGYTILNALPEGSPVQTYKEKHAFAGRSSSVR